MISLGLNEKRILNLKRSWLFFLSPFQNRIIRLPYLFLRYIFDEVVLTNQKFHVREGLIWKSATSTPLRKINNVAYAQGLFGRIFGYREILIESAALIGITRYPYIKNPEKVKNAIEQAIEDSETK